MHPSGGYAASHRSPKAELHATDVVTVVQPSGHVACSSFNVVNNNGVLGAVRASVEINGCATELVMIHDQQAGCFVFPGGSLQPEQHVLLSLPLVRGRNRLEFFIDAGTSACADLWLWSARDRIVVVDVDGTITKSDVLGLATSFFSNLNPWTKNVAKTLNKDYTHDGVAEALTFISRCNYQMLYLTARPITLAGQTREFLLSVGKSQNASLPEGPIITQPHGTIKSLQVKHEVFKIDVLSKIQELFYSSADSTHGLPSTESGPVPFAAGFGNHETDVMAYTSAGISATHIFVLDTTSDLRIHGCGTKVKSYTGLMPHLPALFQPLRPADAGDSEFQCWARNSDEVPNPTAPLGDTGSASRQP
jgi:phosphatidate phosphatase LPIN